VPSTKDLTFFRFGAFTIDILYVDENQVRAPISINSYMISPFLTSKGEKAKLKVGLQLDKHGIFFVNPATLIKEEEIEVHVSSGK